MSTPINSRKKRLSLLSKKLFNRPANPSSTSIPSAKDDDQPQRAAKAEDASSSENLGQQSHDLKERMPSDPHPHAENNSEWDLGRETAEGRRAGSSYQSSSATTLATGDSTSKTFTNSLKFFENAVAPGARTTPSNEATPVYCAETISSSTVPERADFLVRVANKVLELANTLDDLLSEHRTLTKIGGGLPACLMSQYKNDGSGQDLRAFARNSLALGENKFELQGLEKKTHQQIYKISERRLILVVDRLALIFDRLIGTSNRIALQDMKIKADENEDNIREAILKILHHAASVVKENYWTHLYLQDLLVFYKVDASLSFHNAISAPVQHLNEILARSSKRDSSIDGRPKVWGLPKRPKTPIPSEEDERLASDHKVCPACHPSSKHGILRLDTSAKYHSWRRNCRSCKNEINSDFVRETVISMAISRKSGS